MTFEWSARDRVEMALGNELRDYRILFRWCIPAVEAFSRATVVVVCRCGFGYRDQADNGDAELARLIHPARCRN